MNEYYTNIAVLLALTTLLFLVLFLIEFKKRKRSQSLYNSLDKQYSEALGKSLYFELEYNNVKDQFRYEKDQSEEIRKLHDKTRRLKHDMKNHIMIISSYLHSNEYIKARDYLSHILDQLNKIYTYIETGNSVLNHIINTKLEYAKLNDVSVKAEIENLTFERMESLDFSSLLANLLDNAIEASLKASVREIHVNIKKIKGYDTILIKNRTEEAVLAVNPQLESTKGSKTHHGYGIKQIKSIVEKYDGMINFYEDNGMFCAYVMILSDK